MVRRVRFPSRCQGFALAAVLWLMAGLSIVVVLVADAAQSSAERVAQLRERTEFIRSALSGRAQAQYWLSGARPRTADFFDGAAVVLADGTPYKTNAISTIALQDHGGLIDLNTANRELMAGFLIGCAVPAVKTDALIDALSDYIDEDNMQRLSGAERDTYTSEGKLPPRNSPLLSEAEVWDVYGWAPYRAIFERNGCEQGFTVYGETTMLGSSLNLATAPASVLRGSGFSEEIIMDIVSARSDPTKIAERLAQNNALIGAGGLFGGAGNKQVQKVLRVTQRHTTGPWVMRYTLTLDPNSDDRPWSISQPYVGAEPVLSSKINALPWPNQPPASMPSDVSRFLSF